MARIAVLADYYHPAKKAGGPVRTLTAMVSRSGHRSSVFVATCGFDLGETRPLPVTLDEWTQSLGTSAWYRSKGVLAYSRMLIAVRRISPTTIYINSIFSPTSAVAPILLHRLGFFGPADLVVAPRGELDPGALATRPTKKCLYLTILRRILHPRISLWHASARLEAQNISASFPGARVVIHPNENDLPDRAARPHARRDRRRIVFFSRIAPKKGLHILLEALGYCTFEASLDVVGGAKPQDDKYLRECIRIAASLPDHIEVRFLGHRDLINAQTFLTHYDMSVLPTSGENFGHTIIESMSAATPIMVPSTTPWTNVLSKDSLVVPTLDPVDWAESITRFLSLSQPQMLATSSSVGDAFNIWQSQQRQRPSFIDLLAEDCGERKPL